MMGRTHALLALSCLWLLEAGPPSSPGHFALAALGAVLGALLPDLDAPTSLLQTLRVGGMRPLVLPARVLNRSFGHRGATHSLLALIIVALLAAPLLGLEPLAWLGLVLGYLSHLLGDACTKSGVPLFFPRRQKVHLLPKPLRLSTGSLAEEGVFALVAMLAITLLLRHLLLAASISVTSPPITF